MCVCVVLYCVSVCIVLFCLLQECVCCVVRSVPPSKFVMSVKSTIVLNVLPGPMLFVKYNTNDIWSC